MFRRTYRRLFSHLVREVDTAGFVGDFRRLSHVHAASTQKKANEALHTNTNVLYCGHQNTGKLTLLKAIGEQCEKQGKKVAYVSADSQRANRLDGLLIHFFIGLRPSRDELPSQEQLEGTLERHVRLVESTYASCIPSLCTVDVLILDALQCVQSSVLLSMDAVARRLRQRPNEPFGGLRVYAAANFWQLPVNPSSDTGGYLYQLEQWSELFPKQNLLRTTHGQEKDLQRFTEAAFFGSLTLDDMKELEARSIAGKPEATLLSWTSSTMQVDDGRDEEGEAAAEDDDDVDAMSAAQLTRAKHDLLEDEDESAVDLDGDEAEDTEGNASDPTSLRRNGGKGESMMEQKETSFLAAAAASPQLTPLHDDISSSAKVLMRMRPRFPRQPALQVQPPRASQLRRTEIGHFLFSMLTHSTLPHSYGLMENLSVDVGSRVHLVLDGQKEYGVPAGAVGEVMQVRPHYLSIHFPREHRTVDLPRMRLTCYHPQYPELRQELQQFPVFPRQRLCPLNVVTIPNTYYVNLNSRRMADTNDLGNVLACMRTFADFTMRNTSDFAHLDGMIHEPTRIYYHQIAHQPISTAPEQWCRNCKSFVPTTTFFEHWFHCVKSVRWCNDCSKTVPLELLEPHMEKHQVVFCLDCGGAVEWRHWEAHRLSCPLMMREISVDNQFIPVRTRQLALEMGLDKRDLHTMRNYCRTSLPRPRNVLRG